MLLLWVAGRRKGLKTGMYYLRTKAAVDAIKFTVDAKAAEAASFVQNGNKENDEVSQALSDAVQQTSIGQDSSGVVGMLEAEMEFDTSVQ